MSRCDFGLNRPETATRLPLKAGLVTSLARPGGNITGITLDAGIEIWEKRLQEGWSKRQSSILSG